MLLAIRRYTVAACYNYVPHFRRDILNRTFMSFTRIFTLNLVEFRETSSARLVLTSLKVGAKIHGIIGNRVRSYSKQGYGDESFAYHEKGLSVAYFIQDEDWSLKALEAVNLLNTEENSSPLVLLPNPGTYIFVIVVPRLLKHHSKAFIVISFIITHIKFNSKVLLSYVDLTCVVFKSLEQTYNIGG